MRMKMITVVRKKELEDSIISIDNIRNMDTEKREQQSLDERDTTVKQLKRDLTFFNNIPPTSTPDPKECILARISFHLTNMHR